MGTGCGAGLICDDAQTCVDDGCGSEGQPCCPMGGDGCDFELICGDDQMCAAP
jgi:hypothetical protein